jgi:hypothetical protein
MDKTKIISSLFIPLAYNRVKNIISKQNQMFWPTCSELALEYAGQSFLLQELTTRTVTKATTNNIAIFFIEEEK